MDAPAAAAAAAAVDVVLRAGSPEEALGLEPAATATRGPTRPPADKVHKAYLRACLRVHPDKNGDPRAGQAFKLLSSHREALLTRCGGGGGSSGGGGGGTTGHTSRFASRPPVAAPPALPARAGLFTLGLRKNGGGYEFLCLVSAKLTVGACTTSLPGGRQSSVWAARAALRYEMIESRSQPSSASPAGHSKSGPPSTAVWSQQLSTFSHARAVAHQPHWPPLLIRLPRPSLVLPLSHVLYIICPCAPCGAVATSQQHRADLGLRRTLPRAVGGRTARRFYRRR